MKYRKLKQYKYQVMQDISYKTKIRLDKAIRTKNGWVSLSKSGLLKIRAGYATDGPSGPTIDTKTFMRGATLHDGLYQLIRSGLLDKKYRKYADEALRDVCLEDGMIDIRTKWVYGVLRAFGWIGLLKIMSEPKILET